jgi:hypothetical protein
MGKYFEILLESLLFTSNSSAPIFLANLIILQTFHNNWLLVDHLHNIYIPLIIFYQFKNFPGHFL